MYDVFLPRRSGLAMASAVAFLISGCDAAGPGSNPQSVEADGPSDSRLKYRDGGVVLSKRATDELADFVTATQFDAVLPMSIRLQAMNPHARDAFLNRIESARVEVDEAVKRVRADGADPSERDVARLNAANLKIERMFELISTGSERGRSRDRAKRLIEMYPLLGKLSLEQMREVLTQSVQKSGKGPDPAGSEVPFSILADTGQGDNCQMDCSITAAIAFGSVELIFGASLLGCLSTAVGTLPCWGIASAIKYYGLGSLVWDLYSCTKKCP